ncbi:MAG: TetR/AcrR family transcriptional regulator [Rhodospirillales bacterium]|nr:TetR/AcrR family transcriptional regulator [Rhodospirillales bacterium]
MTRWQPDARGRLAQAALELYAERGFDGTTVADIAERAGVTERTFFRHFADKREVLFADGDVADVLVEGVAGETPLAAAIAGFAAVGAVIQDRRAFAEQRNAVIAASPDLQERELIKLASWADAVRDALLAQGVDPTEAALAAQVALAVFRSAFQRWLTSGKDADFARSIRETADALRALVV